MKRWLAAVVFGLTLTGVAHRTDYDTAVRDFRWPQLETFNWALDYFDTMAQGNQANALWIVEEDASEQRYSFAQLSARSNQVANHLRALGVKRGERILLMLGNDVALWETMLGAFKLGAVVIPATALLTAEDLQDRIERGDVRHLVVGSAHVGKFAGLGQGCSRVCVGAAPEGWVAHAASGEYSEHFEACGQTKASDPMLLYFTSGTTSKPENGADT